MADRGPGVARVRQARLFAEFSLDTFEAPAGARALDVGTGVGAMAAQLARLCPGIRLTGVDISAAQIARAREIHPVATYVQASRTALPFAAGSFDEAHELEGGRGRLRRVVGHRVRRPNDRRRATAASRAVHARTAHQMLGMYVT